MYNRGSRRHEGQEREAQNSGEQRHEEICGRKRDGVGYTGLDTQGGIMDTHGHSRDFQEGKQGI